MFALSNEGVAVLETTFTKYSTLEILEVITEKILYSFDPVLTVGVVCVLPSSLEASLWCCNENGHAFKVLNVGPSGIHGTSDVPIHVRKDIKTSIKHVSMHVWYIIVEMILLCIHS